MPPQAASGLWDCVGRANLASGFWQEAGVLMWVELISRNFLSWSGRGPMTNPWEKAHRGVLPPPGLSWRGEWA